MRLNRKVAMTMVLAAVAAGPVAAQSVMSAKSGVVSYVMGQVTVGGQVVKASETKFTEVKENAVLRTEEGRAETLLTMGAVMRTGDNASFKMLSTRLIDTRLDLQSGSHVVEVTEIPKDNNLTLAAKDATVVVTKRGLYRFDVDQARIKVFDGVLGVTINGQSMLLGAGKMVDTATAAVTKFDREETDALDHWARQRAELVAMANTSSAKRVYDSGCAPSTHFASSQRTSGSGDPCDTPCGVWTYNPWYGMVTYIPCGGNVYSPYGYRYWNPNNVMQAYYTPPPSNFGNNGGGNGSGTYNSTPQTSSGNSGTMATSTSGVSSSTAAASSGSSVSSSSGSASSGHGSSGGGGHK